MSEDYFIHPYIPNAVPETKEAMLREIGKQDARDIYEPIPEHLRFKGRLDIPGPIHSEAELKRHGKSVLRKNADCDEYLSFLGAGVWQHHVPAAVDEVVNRAEFVSAYDGMYYTDHGKWQAKWEFASQLAELVDFDVVTMPFYDWGTVLGLALRMATRITGRRRVLCAVTTGPERLTVARTMCPPPEMAAHIALETVAYDAATGELDLGDLRARISDDTAAVYVETPSFLGAIEGRCAEIAGIAHDAGALFIVGADPISLGVLAAPGSYGADIAIGPIQPLGVHLNCGGGLGGYMAFRDEPVYCGECPLLLFTVLDTEREGEYAFAEVMEERTSYGLRDQGRDWVGTSAGLWTIAAAVYMSLMGPKGFQEVGDTILKRSHYAAGRLAAIPGVKQLFGPGFFKEFVVNLDVAGTTVATVNAALRERGIFGGYDLSRQFPELGQSMLICVTEMHTKDDIDRLAEALGEAVRPATSAGKEA
jgi:glycine cleavage system P protein (glycine dehydrogenase) subunit 1